MTTYEEYVRRTIYQVATLSLDAQGRWTVTYHGDVPEQGGIERKTGQLTFTNSDDACEFMRREVAKHREYYLEIIQKKEAKP